MVKIIILILLLGQISGADSHPLSKPKTPLQVSRDEITSALDKTHDYDRKAVMAHQDQLKAAGEEMKFRGLSVQSEDVRKRLIEEWKQKLNLDATWSWNDANLNWEQKK